MIRSTLLTASVLAFGGAAPAMAQEQTPFTDAVLLIAAKCFDVSPLTTTSGVISICQQASKELTDKTYDGYTAGNEANVYRTMKALVLMTLGSKMGEQDGSRSQRSCQSIEEAWSYAVQVDVSSSPKRAAQMTEIRNGVMTATRVCRQDFGTPAGGRPLL